MGLAYMTVKPKAYCFQLSSNATISPVAMAAASGRYFTEAA